MKKIYLLLALICTVSLLLVFSCTQGIPMVSFQGHSLPLTIASTPENRESWLKGRAQELNGLFILDFGYSSYHAFHMYKVYLPLEAYGVDEKGKICCHFQPAPYETGKEIPDMPLYESSIPIRYFYFLPRTLASSFTLKEGQTVELYSSSVTHFRAQIKEKTLDLLISATPEERERGLMYRSRLTDTEGMLFLFSEERTHSFWMKNCKIPMALAYLEKDGTIGEIYEMEVPAKGLNLEEYPKYESKKAYPLVLEVAKGWFERHGIQKKDRFLFQPELRFIKKR